jgi:hypothetical protein
MPHNGNRANTARGSRPGSHLIRSDSSPEYPGIGDAVFTGLDVAAIAFLFNGTDATGIPERLQDVERKSHPGLGLQTTSDRPIVRINAITEMIVSHTDQVLIVWTTVIPKYSFTSQKPPSLT